MLPSPGPVYIPHMIRERHVIILKAAIQFRLAVSSYIQVIAVLPSIIYSYNFFNVSLVNL